MNDIDDNEQDGEHCKGCTQMAMLQIRIPGKGNIAACHYVTVLQKNGKKGSAWVCPGCHSTHFLSWEQRGIKRGW